MKATLLSFQLCILLVGLCYKAQCQVVSQQNKTALSVTDKVRESVFRYQFSKFGVVDKEAGKHFFIGVGYQKEADPTPGLINRLQSRRYSVAGISQCVLSTGG